MIIHNETVAQAGVPLEDADKALIMLHDRGKTASGFIKMGEKFTLDTEQFAILAVQAIQNEWFPEAITAPIRKNQPQLDSSLNALDEVVHNLADFDIPPKNIYFLGEGQGASLLLEFLLRRGGKWGGAIAFDGGIMGDQTDLSTHQNDLGGTTVFMGNQGKNPNITKERIELTKKGLGENGAGLTLKTYPEPGKEMDTDKIMMADLVLNNKL